MKNLMHFKGNAFNFNILFNSFLMSLANEEKMLNLIRIPAIKFSAAIMVDHWKTNK